MSYASRFLPVAACLLLTGCVFAVDSKMESEDSNDAGSEDEDTQQEDAQNGEEPDPDVSITGPGDVLYVDGDDFTVDYEITCEPEGCEEQLRCATIQGEGDPEFDSCDTTFSVTEDYVSEGEHTVEVELVDDDEILASDSHTSVVLFEFDVYIDTFDSEASNPFSHPDLGSHFIECTHSECVIVDCGWSDGDDADDADCSLDDPVELKLYSDTFETTFDIAVCAEPTWADEDIEHCQQVSYDFHWASPVWTHVDAGRDYTCGILDDYSLWCWGAGEDGRLGLGDEDEREYPVEAVEGRWRSVSAGRHHVCAISVEHKLYCWGNNTASKAHPPTEEEQLLTPTAHDDHLWEAVSAGWNHTCAITADEPSQLLCWGLDTEDLLGEGSDDGAYRIVDYPDDVETWIDIASAHHHSCALAQMNDGQHNVYCWGSRSNGGLGDGLDGLGDEDPTTPVPQLVGGIFEDKDVLKLSNHDVHNCAVIEGGDQSRQIYCWGNAGHGRLGNGESSGYEASPVPVVLDEDDSDVLSDLTSISMGERHSCASDDTGVAYCWGASNFGTLGNESADGLFPTPVDWSEVDSDTTLSISAGRTHSCAITDNYSLYCWGEDNGQLGYSGSITDDVLPTPTPVHWPFAPE